MATRWDKLRSATLGAPAREEAARLIRDERSREPVVERGGTLVEFRRGGQMMCGYLQCPPRGLLRVVGVDGRLRRLRRDKIVDMSRSPARQTRSKPSPCSRGRLSVRRHPRRR